MNEFEIDLYKLKQIEKRYWPRWSVRLWQMLSCFQLNELKEKPFDSLVRIEDRRNMGGVILIVQMDKELLGTLGVPIDEHHLDCVVFALSFEKYEVGLCVSVKNEQGRFCPFVLKNGRWAAIGG